LGIGDPLKYIFTCPAGCVAPGNGLSGEDILSLDIQVTEIVLIGSDRYDFPEFIDTLWNYISHDHATHHTLAKQVNLFQQQPFLDLHEFIDVQVQETAIFHPDLLVSTLFN
jgi:hypothetical protein